MRAYLTLPVRPPYDAPTFAAGLRAAGYSVIPRAPLPNEATADTVLLIWNRSRSKDDTARMVESAGGRVLVAENAYLGGPDWRALALRQHAGAGEWPEGDDGRWDALGLALEPWRASGGHVLVLGQRGIGHPSVAMPQGWDRRMLALLQKRTARRLVFRPHPATVKAPRPLADDLVGCHAVVTWSSAAGLQALVAGIPVFCGLRKWIGAAACWPAEHDIEDPWLGDRLPMLRRLAWAQWTLTELSSGEPFRRLLGTRPHSPS